MAKYHIDFTYLEPEQLPTESCQIIAYAIGMDNLFKLAEAIGGSQFYLPKSKDIFRAARDNSIIKEFDGSNYTALARKYNVTDQWIRQIVKKHR